MSWHIDRLDFPLWKIHPSKESKILNGKKRMAMPTHDQAEKALADAQDSRTRLAAGQDWLRAYLLVFAAGSVGIVLIFGLGGRTGVIVGMTLWISLITVMSWWGAKHSVVLRGHKRRSRWAFGAWAVLYGMSIFVGTILFAGEPAFWIPAAALSAVPFVVGAFWPPSPAETHARNPETV